MRKFYSLSVACIVTVLCLFGIEAEAQTQLNQGFESVTFPPTGWTNSSWTRSTTASDVAVGSAAATAGANNGILTTSAISYPSSVSFYLGRSTNATAKTLNIRVSTTTQVAAATGTIVATYDHSTVASGTYIQYTVDLSAYKSFSTVYIAFEKVSSTTSPWRLDQIVVTTAEPTTQASSVNFTSVANTSFTANWTNGNGSRRAVFMREADAGTITNPSDGTKYTASADWSSKGTQLGTSGYYCIYDGTGTSVSVTNLTSGTAYYVQVFEYNSDASVTAASINYYTATATNNPNNQTTTGGCSAPGTQVSNLAAGSATSSQFNVTWTAGTGDGSMVVIRPTAQSILAPTSGNAYTANTDYTLAGQINTDNRVVFRAAGTSVTPTNLSAETQYTVTAYEYNSSGDCYNLTSPPSVTLFTLSTAPSAHAAAFSSSAASPTSIDLSFSAASTITNADGYIIIQRSGSAPTGTPTNGTGYSVGNAIGDGTVAAIITSTASTGITITGLNAATQYHFVLIPYNYNGSNAATYNYYTAATIPSTNATTQSLSAPSISSPTATGISNNAATLGGNVTSDGGAAISARGVVWSQTSLNNDPTIGDGNSTNVTGSGTTGVFTVNAGSLPAATQISYKAYATNSQGTSYTTATTFTTLSTAPTTAATSMTFGTYTTNSVQLSWTNGDGAARIVVARLNATSRVAPTNGTGYTPADADFSNGSNPTTGTGNVVIYNGTASTVTVSGLASGTAYAFDVYEFNGSGVTANYFGTVLTGSKSTIAAEPTVQASSVTFTNVTATGFKINWTLGNGANSLVVVKDGGAVDADPVDGTSYSANLAFGSGNTTGTGNYVVYRATLNTATITGLTDGHTYHVAVYTYNGNAGSGAENYLLTPATSSQIAATVTYYSQSSGDPATMSNWNSARNGSGSAPAALTDGNFVIQNTHNMTTTGTVSFGASGYKLQIENGGTLTANNAVTIVSGTTFQIDNGGTYIHNNTGTPGTTIFNGTESFGVSSNFTIQNWNGTGSIPSATFGNLTITYSPTAAWNQSGSITSIKGNFTLNNASSNAFRFCGNANFTLTVEGDFVVTSGLLQFNNGSAGNTYVLNIGGSYNQTGGTFDPNTSTSNLTINFTGTNKTFTQSAGTLTNTRINWALSNGASLTIASNFTLAGSRTFTLNTTSALTVAENVALTIAGTADFNNQSVTFKSSATGTARLANITGSITNATNVTIERYIPAKRAWRLLTAPLTGSSNNSVYYNWQNNGVTGSGVEIWGPGGSSNPSSGNGLAAGTGTSMRKYTSSGWTNITDTKNESLFSGTGNNAFAIFVTGPFQNGSGNIATGSVATTLSATGTLRTGAVSFTNIATSNHTMIGNPYASPVDLDAAITAGTNLQQFAWFWDPQLGTVGGYTTYDVSANSYSDVSGSFTNATVLQSGQAFFVKATGAAGTLNFTEANKTTTSTNAVFRTANGIEIFRTKLSRINAGTPLTVDAVMNVYNAGDNAAVDAGDASKFSNPGENMSIIRNGSYLSVEHRPVISANDTIFLTLWNMTATNYRFAFTAENMSSSGLSAFLEDAYLNTSTPVSLNGNTVEVDFAVTSNAATTGNRFRIVFRPATTLPLAINNIKAFEKGNAIAVEWSNSSETNVERYEVERSADGRNFTKAATVSAKANNGSAVNYQWIDNNPLGSTNYYRIKVLAAGDNKYSSIVKVNLQKGTTYISLYPNPVKGESVQLQLSNLAKGQYTIKMYNSAGQQVYQRSLQHNGGSASETISLGNALPSGSYVLRLTGTDIDLNQRIIIEKP